jgi:hypothetical protein
MTEQRAYSELYVADIIQTQARVFELFCEDFPSLDVRKIISDFMCSKYRFALDKGDFQWANMTPGEWLKYFLDLPECQDKSRWVLEAGRQPLDSLVAYWMGLIYSEYQWTYNVTSKWLVRALPVSGLERVFNPLHTISESRAVEVIYERWLAPQTREKI